MVKVPCAERVTVCGCDFCNVQWQLGLCVENRGCAGDQVTAADFLHALEYKSLNQKADDQNRTTEPYS